ncbi:hypothetical protein CMO88_00580 [Candidatus Woesearchaeota archaeon]|nr:hypothetical protein [Candidatus Woesearchaeota archaeon]|tara:strand:- start:15531 stop:16088 length:558 start_codon:yes stop_codon:yes gene_type:complete
MKISKQQAFAWFKKSYLKLIFAIVALILLSLLLGTSVKTLVFAIVLILLASFSTFYFNYVTAPVNFELVKMSTILMAYTHGIIAGLIVGIAATIIGKILIGRIDEKLPISVAAISIVAVAAGLFSAANIVVLGILLVGFYNISLFSISMTTGGDLGWNIPYEGTNFAINFILFTRIAPFILPLLQ